VFRKAVASLFFVLCSVLFLRGEIVLPQNDFMPGWIKEEAPRTYQRGDLFDYIDGGAEIFIEFGFEKLFVQRYKKDASELALEVFQMDGPDAALGIYLMKCGQETPFPGIRARNSGDKTQFTILKGRYFLHVNNFDSDENLVPIMVELTRLTLGGLPDEKPSDRFAALPKKDLVRGSERLIRGPYALQPIFTFGEGDILQLKGQIFGLVADYKDPGGDIFTRVIIAYPDEATASAVLRHLVTNHDPYLKILDRWERGFLFEDFQNKFGSVKVRGERLDCLINLSRKPEKPLSPASGFD
jgi:hypothetical protein